MSNPNGSLSLAESYMKKAGYPSGKYTGTALLTIADNEPPASNTALAVESQLAQLGFKLNFREVPHATVLSKFCLVPKAKVAICPTLGWGKDFYDSQSMIDPVFNGKNIVPVGNTNTAQANDPTLNAQMNAAEELIDPAQRAFRLGQARRRRHRAGVCASRGCGTTRSRSPPRMSTASTGRSTATHGTSPTAIWSRDNGEQSMRSRAWVPPH